MRGKKRGKPLTLEIIKTAVCNLYDSWENLPPDSRELITKIMNDNSYDALYEQYRSYEIAIKESLINFDNQYPEVANTDNVNDIIRNLKNLKKQND